MSSAYDAIIGDVSAVEAETRRAEADALEILQNAMGLYSEGFDAVEPRESSDAGLLQMGFLSQAFNSLLAAVDAARKGLYVQSIQLVRFVFESWATYWYLEANPDDADRWLSTARDRKPPKIETMLNRLDHPNGATKSNAGAHRTTLSHFAHADPLAVKYLIEQKSGNTVVRCGVVYDHGKFETSCCLLAVWLGNMLDALKYVIPVGHSWHERRSAIEQVLLSYIDKVQEQRAPGEPTSGP